MPAGAIRGKRLLIGAGVALDPDVLSVELKTLGAAGVKVDLTIDSRCSLVSPVEKEMDSFLEKLRGGHSLGTTKMGLGPAYAMRALRLSPRALDLFSGEFDPAHQKKFYQLLGLDSSALDPWLKRSRAFLRGRLGDVASTVSEMSARGESVLLEGAHGTMLDILFGTYPFVTSSQTIAANAAAGLGVAGAQLGEVLGVVKSYATRVGAGPFPTEQRGAVATTLRKKGGEYGVTTGRPRRIGWLDLVALKYAVRLNGATGIALTKVDVLAAAGELKVCVAYEHGRKRSSEFHEFLGTVEKARPIYRSLPPLKERSLRDPKSGPLGSLVELIEDQTGVPVKIISYGEERERTHEL